MSFAVQSRLARFLKYHYQARRQRDQAQYGRVRDARFKRWAIALAWGVSALYLAELAALVASASSGCSACN